MTPELTMLALSVLLGIVQTLLGSETGAGQRSRQWAAGSRDAAMPPLTGVPARLQRAQRNFLETFPLFAAAVVAAPRGPQWRAHLLGRATLFLGPRVMCRHARRVRVRPSSGA
jgi:uncharacterized MAPEG superfamily protein